VSTTGEQPAAKEPVLSLNFDRIMVLLGFITSVAVAYGGYTVMRSEVERNSVRITKLEDARESDKDDRAMLSTRVAVVESSLSDIKASLGRIEGLLGSSRTTNAVHRPRPDQ
jgi:hypothetical protein